MKRYKETVDAIQADDELRAAIAALPRELHKPKTVSRRIGLTAAVLAVVIAVGAISVPLFSTAMGSKSADAAAKPANPISETTPGLRRTTPYFPSWRTIWRRTSWSGSGKPTGTIPSWASGPTCFP